MDEVEEIRSPRVEEVNEDSRPCSLNGSSKEPSSSLRSEEEALKAQVLSTSIDIKSKSILYALSAIKRATIQIGA